MIRGHVRIKNVVLFLSVLLFVSTIWYGLWTEEQATRVNFEGNSLMQSLVKSGSSKTEVLRIMKDYGWRYDDRRQEDTFTEELVFRKRLPQGLNLFPRGAICAVTFRKEKAVKYEILLY